MKIPVNYDSNIGNIINPTLRSQKFFISDWDLHNPQFYNIPSCFTNPTNLSEEIPAIKQYYFVNEMEIYKRYFAKNQKLPEEIAKNISIFPNGTVAAYLILELLFEKGTLNSLLLSPTYFTYIDMLKKLHGSIYYYQVLDDNGNLKFDIAELEQQLISQRIELLIITDPLFGSGISLTEDFYTKIFNICHHLNIFIFIDYIYGGMPWNNNINLLSELNIFNHNENVFIFRSLSKNLFLNGAKTCLVYGPQRYISEIEKQSVYKLGSLSYKQLEVFLNLYSDNNKNIVETYIQNICNYCSINYEILSSLCVKTKVKLASCQGGMFCIMGIPKYCFRTLNDDKISEELSDKLNIITIPHSRYLFFSNKYYWFRINLSYPKEILLSNVNKIIQYINKSGEVSP